MSPVVRSVAACVAGSTTYNRGRRSPSHPMLSARNWNRVMTIGLGVLAFAAVSTPAESGSGSSAMTASRCPSGAHA